MTGTTAVFSANVGSIGWTVNGRMRIGQVIVYLMLLCLALQRSDLIPVTGSLRPPPPRRLAVWGHQPCSVPVVQPIFPPIDVIASQSEPQSLRNSSAILAARSRNSGKNLFLALLIVVPFHKQDHRAQISNAGISQQGPADQELCSNCESIAYLKSPASLAVGIDH